MVTVGSESLHNGEGDGLSFPDGKSSNPMASEVLSSVDDKFRKQRTEECRKRENQPEIGIDRKTTSQNQSVEDFSGLYIFAS